MCYFNRAAFVALLCLGSIGWCQSQTAKAKREVRDAEMAESAILSSLVYQLSPKGEALLCYGNRIPCLGQARDTLALALIGEQKNERSLRSFASLVRFTLDGGLHEQYMSYAIEKGDAMLPVLASLSAEQLQQKCHDEFAHLKDSSKGVNERSVCRDASSIKGEIARITAAVSHRKGTKGDDERGEEPRTEADVVRMAENGLFSELAVRRSPNGRSLCAGETSIACLGPNRMELGVALLCSQRSQALETALAELVRYRLGNSLQQEYKACLEEHGSGIQKASLNPEGLHQQCSQEFKALMQSYSDRLEGLQEEELCADVPSIQKAIQEILPTK